MRVTLMPTFLPNSMPITSHLANPTMQQRESMSTNLVDSGKVHLDVSWRHDAKVCFEHIVHAMEERNHEKCVHLSLHDSHKENTRSAQIHTHTHTCTQGCINKDAPNQDKPRQPCVNNSPPQKKGKPQWQHIDRPRLVLKLLTCVAAWMQSISPAVKQKKESVCVCVCWIVVVNSVHERNKKPVKPTYL